MTTPEQVLDAASTILTAEDAVTDGWRCLDTALDEGRLVVAFTWRRLPYRFVVRFGLEDLTEGVWTGAPVADAREWVHELAGLLMEELDTGAAAWLDRVKRADHVELLLDRPRLDELPPALTADHAVSEIAVDAAWFVRQEGLDPAPALAAAQQGLLRRWWVAYVNDVHGRPFVAQLVVTGDEAQVRLAHLQVRDDLPVPDAVVTRMLYLAVFSAACDGARRVTCDVDHPAVAAVGLERHGDGWQWRADGPVLLPPRVAQPAHVDPDRVRLLSEPAPSSVVGRVGLEPTTEGL